jgi:prepilin-type N-terminal cleavage/methylation domain-containing protein
MVDRKIQLRLAQKARGFTLVELLVVIGVIAVLIALLMPALNAARRAAQSAGCLSNLRPISAAVFLYAADYEGTMPIQISIGYTDVSHLVWNYSDNMGMDPNHYDEAYTLLAYLDHTYLKNPTVFTCPAADPDGFFDPAYPYDYYSSPYGVAAGGCYDGAVFSYATQTNTSGYPTTFKSTWLRLAMIVHPDQRLMVADKGGTRFGVGDGGPNTWMDIRRGNGGYLWTNGGVDSTARHGGEPASSTNWNVNGKVNFVCADGHTETDTYADVQQASPSGPATWNWLGSN